MNLNSVWWFGIKTQIVLLSVILNPLYMQFHHCGINWINVLFYMYMLETCALCLNMQILLFNLFFVGQSLARLSGIVLKATRRCLLLQKSSDGQKNIFKRCPWNFRAWTNRRDSPPSARTDTAPLKAALSTETVSLMSAAGSAVCSQPPELASIRLTSHL